MSGGFLLPETGPLCRNSREAAVPGFPGSAVKQLEDRFENLVRILLDRGVVDVKDLDELM